MLASNLRKGLGVMTQAWKGLTRGETGFGSVNKITLIGNAGRDPDVIKVSDQIEICRFSLATSYHFRNREGEMVRDAEWHNITIFNPALRDFAARFVKKGSRVYVEGRLKYRRYTDKEGIERVHSEVVLGREGSVQILEKRLREDEEGDDELVEADENMEGTGDREPIQTEPVRSDGKRMSSASRTR